MLHGVLRRGLALRLVLAGAAAVVLAAASAAPALASPRICLYVEDRVVFAGSNTGHAFVQLLPDAGPQAGQRDLVYGFYPKTKVLFLTGSEGDIKSDATSDWKYKKCLYVTRDKYDKAANQVADDLKKTPRYALLSFNCVDWAFRIAGAAGMSLPPANLLFSNVLDPERLMISMRSEFNGQGGRNNPGANGIFSNSARVKPTDAADAPKVRFWTDSYTDLASDARSAPHALAGKLDMTAHVRSLPSVTLGLHKRLRLFLDIPGHHPALTRVWFGDGAQAGQHRTFLHTYRRPGTYRATGVAIANATVYKFSLRVAVDRSHGGAATAVPVPSDKPKHHRLPPLPPSPPVPQPE
jgi:hypothetical protein